MKLRCKQMDRIGFGGSCHWCTEAIFQSLKGVAEVQQGWIASEGSASKFSEAVIVNYQPEKISLELLVAVHLHTHSCTANHSMRGKYRSAVYTFNEEQEHITRQAIINLQPNFDEPIITQVLPFKEFSVNSAEYLNYYYSNPDKPFCANIVSAKLKELTRRFPHQVNTDLLQ
ncbi:peptide-methionine (S)-S-oxide reductase [Mucilaginibacter sp.]|uniref:peptide-methionine (S)-S-oxide reductase n=1 Tax=Mucilaginibacter sp. TaxID=1882438 RepID=UPI0035BC2D30